MIGLFLIVAFLVKLPIFLVHQWLPKAHVEAPVAGSIFLAAILLKLGGYGLTLVQPLLPLSSPVTYWILSLVIVGGGAVGILCLRQLDLKVIIAYSSVSHIAFVAVGLILGNIWAVTGAILIIIAHGVCSSGLFAGANVMYSRRHSRLMTLNKGILIVTPAFTLIWFLLRLGNIGAPPTINLIREIFSIIGILNYTWIIWIPVSTITFIAAAYTLILFSSTQQGKTSPSLTSIEALNHNDLNILRTHVIWLFLIVLRLSIFIYTNIIDKFDRKSFFIYNCWPFSFFPIF